MPGDSSSRRRRPRLGAALCAGSALSAGRMAVSAADAGWSCVGSPSKCGCARGFSEEEPAAKMQSDFSIFVCNPFVVPLSENA